MDRNRILQEMGIKVWIPRDAEVKAQEFPQNIEENSPLASEKILVEPNQVISSSPEQAQSLPGLEMKWTILYDQKPLKSSQLGIQIERVLDDLGVLAQFIEVGEQGVLPSIIDGQVVIAFGQRIGQLISGERDDVEHLRGILFDVQNNVGEEIPALVTYAYSDLRRNPKKKSSFWDDLLWARSIWLDSRLY